ncbi:MAG: hypothetical protein KF734_12060 [Saprospiraceae bacterium]|nr:hypothetical protein [Saprospiraceae bacterium]
MRLLNCTLCALVLLVSSQSLLAQTTATPPPPTNYYIVDYMKAKPGHAGDYVRLERTVWKDLHKARIKKGGSQTAWWFLEVRMPSGASVEYDYVTVTTVSGWNGIDSLYNSWDDVFRKMSAEQAKHVDSTEMFRTLVRTEIYMDVDAVFKNAPGTVPPPKFWFYNYMDVPDGKWDDYVKMEKEIARPVHLEQCLNGHRAGWGLYSLVFPSGSEMKYEAVTIDFFDKWGDVVADDFAAIFKKVHPTKKMEDVSKTIEASRKLARTEVWVLLDYAQ